jgi:Pao retrotransposon peptidase
MLGLVWRLQEDDLSFDIHSLLEFRSLTTHVPTKRVLLMTAHQLYDQMGLVTPITIVSHILLQQCWCRGLGWDDSLPEDILKQWNSWCDSLSALNELFVPRWIFSNRPGNTKYALHVFCDASEKAYGVVAYLIREDGSPVLLTSRARVAPLERVTLARLELLACLIGARLQSYLRQVYDQFQFDVTMWSDSQVAINWIKTPTQPKI